MTSRRAPSADEFPSSSYPQMPPPGLARHQLERAPPSLGGWHIVPSRPSRGSRQPSSPSASPSASPLSAATPCGEVVAAAEHGEVVAAASERAKRESETPRVATAALSMYVSLMSQGRLAVTQVVLRVRPSGPARGAALEGGARGDAGQASEQAKRESESPRVVTAALPLFLLGVSQLQDRRLRPPAAPWCPC